MDRSDLSFGRTTTRKICTYCQSYRVRYVYIWRDFQYCRKV